MGPSFPGGLPIFPSVDVEQFVPASKRQTGGSGAQDAGQVLQRQPSARQQSFDDGQGRAPQQKRESDAAVFCHEQRFCSATHPAQQ